MAGHSGDTSGNTGGALTGTGGSMLATGSSGPTATGSSSLLTTDSSSSGLYTGYAGDGDTGSAGGHRHSMAVHTHGMKHTHKLSAHSHDMAHYHNFSHSHSVVATVTIPPQTIAIPSHRHTVTIDPHTHDMVYGIYEGGKAGSITIRVDGQDVAGIKGTDMDELDIVAYLAKDGEGRITRGTWHTVELVPDALTRIEANLFVQAFVQSVGGGNY